MADSPDYHKDGYGRGLSQAALLRARQTEAIDWDNIAEEIEGVSKQVWSTAESNLRIALIHVLKWRHQPERRGRSWSNSVHEHLRRFDRVIRKNPSLEPELDEILADAYSDARFDASEETGLDIESFPEAPPSWGEIRGPLSD